MKVLWVEQEVLQPFGGHGIDFFVDDGQKAQSLMAVLRGFAWLHGNPDLVEVLIRPVGEVFTKELIDHARPAIEQYLDQRGPMNGQLTQLTPTLWAHING